MVLASDEWRVFDIDYTNQHYELLPFLCHNHALFHGLVRILVFFCIVFEYLLTVASMIKSWCLFVVVVLIWLLDLLLLISSSLLGCG